MATATAIGSQTTVANLFDSIPITNATNPSTFVFIAAKAIDSKLQESTS